MDAKLRERLTFANVMSLLALFVALGGSSYAAIALEKKSVKSKHIAKKAVKKRHVAKGAVTSGKVRNESLLAKDFAPGQLPSGESGEKGDKGDKGEKGDPGAQGERGPEGLPYTSEIPAGRTVRGYIASQQAATAAGQTFYTSDSFPGPPPEPVHLSNMHHPGEPGYADACSGTIFEPAADPGHLCIYTERAFNAQDVVVGTHTVCCAFTNRWGFFVRWESVSGGVGSTHTTRWEGSWAYTAPE